ncbi:MAG: GAF domain-containing protein [Chloroflexi bacterium]|nr:GAF domain-containing protein [Chloroflexota bacterium]
MDTSELRRLIVRHRHVAPMLSVLLAGTDARLTITALDGEVILDRQTGTAPADAPVERHPIVIEAQTVGWVEGPRPAGSIAAVLSYAGARETDKRALAREALDRYRELNLIYDLADQIGATLEIDAVARVAVAEAGRLPSGGIGFVLLHEPEGDRLVARPAGEGAFETVGRSGPGAGILGAILAGDPEIVNDIAADPRATDSEREFASLVAAPLRVRGERIGVIGTISREPTDYHASDLRLLTAIASLAAPTFEQAAVHETVVRASRAGD